MYSLAIDTSTERAFIALYADDKILATKELDFGFTHSKALLPALEELCEEPKTLDRVIVGRGPGSYTGIRVGVACAKAVSFACKIPLIGVSSLRLFCPPQDVQGSFMAVIDARMGGVYAIKGRIHNQKCEFDGTEELMPLEKSIKEFEKLDYLVTPSWDEIRSRFEEQGVTAFPTILERYPSATRFLEEAKAQYAIGNYSLDGSLSLLYLRKTQAEIDLLAK